MTRAPVKLSREMKLLLLLLLMVALIGLWYLLTNRSASDELANQPQPPVVTGTGPGDDTIPVTPAPSGQDGSPADTTPGVAVQPDAPVQVEVIPPFPTDGNGTEGEADTTDVPPTPSGINPETELAAVPGNNPFRPLQLDANATAGSGVDPSNAPTTAPIVTPSAALPEPVTAPTNPSSFGSEDGPLAITDLPGSSSGSVSGAGPLPVPTIPGGNGSTGSPASPVVVTPISGGTKPVVITPGAGNGTAGGNGTGSNAAGGNGTGTEPTPAPIKPPVAGVSVPSVNRVPTLTPQTGTPTAGAAGAGNGPLASAPVTGTPRPGTPQVITDLGSGNVSGGAPVLNELDSFVQAQDLAFNAVVLGPVNTAIFRSKDGFVVVSVGQTLPDTQVTVKEVTATSATLSLGNNSKTLELDKR